MVLKAGDELRHSSIVNEDYHWRESLYCVPSATMVPNDLIH